MLFETKNFGDILCITLISATLDATRSNDFKCDIMPRLQSNRHIIFDLGKLTFIDSSGLGALLSCQRHIKSHKGDLKLCRMQSTVRVLFEQVRIQRVFEIYELSGRRCGGIHVLNPSDTTFVKAETMQTSIGKILTLCIFIDAFGWELLQRHAFLDDILTVKKPLDTVFGYSSTCDPTILTGKLPREHGHFSFFYYNPQASPFASCRLLAPLPHAVTSRGRVRRMMSRVLQRAYGYSGYFQIYNMPFRHLPLFDYSEKRDLYQSGGINGGQPTIFDHLRQARVPFACSDWRQGESHNISVLTEQMEAGNISFAYLYLAEMDGLLHAHGTHAPQITEKIAWYEAQIRQLLKTAHEHYGEVRLHLFSDHGMADVTETCDLISRIDATGLKFGVDYTAVFDSTMARFWFLKEGVQSRISTALEGEPRGRILEDTTLHAWGCDFPAQKYGELFFLLNPGVLLCPSFMGETPLKGMHGYAPTDRHSRAIYASNVEIDTIPTHLTDLYCLMRQEAGV